MFEVIFLFVLGIIWIVFATIQDIKKREIANWLCFSLAIFALGFRFFYSLFSAGNFNFFYEGLIGLGIFVILGNLLYYGKMFAGGDAKLMMALGAVIPFSSIFNENIKLFVIFFILFLFIGAIYSLGASFYLGIRNFSKIKREFLKQFRKNKKLSIFTIFFAIVLLSFGFLDSLFFILGILIFILPYLYLYVKSVDEVCMVKMINSSKLGEGDWLYKDLRIGKQIIKARWDGLNKTEINLLKKKCKKVIIRQGIQFTPVFLISFILLFIFWKLGLWNSFW